MQFWIQLTSHPVHDEGGELNNIIINAVHRNGSRVILKNNPPFQKQPILNPSSQCHWHSTIPRAVERHPCTPDLRPPWDNPCLVFPSCFPCFRVVFNQDRKPARTRLVNHFSHYSPARTNRCLHLCKIERADFCDMWERTPPAVLKWKCFPGGDSIFESGKS